MKSRSFEGSPISEEFVRELHALLSEAEAMVGDFSGKDSGKDVEGLHARLSEAHKHITALFDQVKDKVATGAQSTDAAIRANPYPLIAAAFGTGVLLGLLLGRPSK